MRVSHLVLLVAYLISFHLCLADETRLEKRCYGDNYTSNSIYQKNLNTLLSSLASNNDINYGFYNVSEGEGNDRVNSIALCRGDISQTSCQNCVKFSTTDLPRLCPNQKEGIVWYDNCMLRYSNKSIFQSWEPTTFLMWNMKNVSDAILFIEKLYKLLPKLKGVASAGDSHTKFAIGDTSYANFTRIFGLVQCTPNLNEVECSNCLDRSFIDIPRALFGRQGGRGIGPSCNFRYEIDPFYQIPSPPSS